MVQQEGDRWQALFFLGAFMTWVPVPFLGLLLLLSNQSSAMAAPRTDQEVLAEARVRTDTPSILDWFRRHTLTASQRAHLRSSIKQLASPDYAMREGASRALHAMGPSALGHLRRALESTDEEMKERLRAAITVIEGKSKPGLAAAAARLLRQRRAADVMRVLFDCLPEMDGDAEDEVLATLGVLGTQDGKVQEFLAEGAGDQEPTRRAAAALVLGRSGSVGQRAAVQRLCADPDALVRFRAAQGLLARRDPAALPVLVALVGDAPAAVTVRADELLAAVARQRASRLLWADDPVTRRRCCTAWESWQRSSGRSDLAKADVDLLPWSPTLQAAALSRALFLALLHNEREVVNRMVDFPFFGPGERPLPAQADFEQAMQDFVRGLAAEVVVLPPFFAVRFFDPNGPTTSPALKAFLSRVPKSELRGVRLAWRFPERGHDVQEVFFVVRNSGGRTRVIALDVVR
jgi:hypothetical protein